MRWFVQSSFANRQRDVYFTNNVSQQYDANICLRLRSA